MTKLRALQFMSAATVVALFDAVFKFYAIARLPEIGRVSFPIDFILHKNPGIAFDIPIPLSIVVIFTLFVLIAIMYLFKKWWNLHPKRSMAAYIIAIGAAGNMVDRIINGFTTDYILIFSRSVINLSDILIIIGTILLLTYTKNRMERRKI